MIAPRTFLDSERVAYARGLLDSATEEIARARQLLESPHEPLSASERAELAASSLHLAHRHSQSAAGVDDLRIDQMLEALGRAVRVARANATAAMAESGR